MALVWRWLLVWTLLLAGGLPLLAAAPDETSAFKAANRELLSGSFERADDQFGKFIQTYTNSPHLAAAALYQAEARLKLGKPAGAIELLSARLPQAGKWTNSYLYYLGEAYARSGNYPKARDTFATLLQHFPASTNGLKAVVGQASACSKLEEWPQVIALLQQTNGLFQLAVHTSPTNEFTQRGLLLLSEAWLHQAGAPRRFAAAETALQPMDHLALNPEVDWQRQDLLCRILLGSGRTNAALENTTNLLAAAARVGAGERLARGYEFRASLLEGLGRFEEAIVAYTNNLADGVPDDLRRLALLQSTKLFLARHQTANAIQTLEKFATQYSNAPAADAALLTLGELYLGQSLPGVQTNTLGLLAANLPTNAMARLQQVVQRFPQSSFVPKAELDLGWCCWLAGDLTNALPHFQAAAQRLSAAGDQAVACFKLADTQAALHDFAHALTNYHLALEKSAALPEVRAGLEESALYQIIHTGVAAGDLASATNAMARLLARFPEGYHTAPAVLLAGQALAEQGHPERARDILLEFTAHVTNAPPEVSLALARTWEEAGNWTNAIQTYRQMLSHCTDGEACAEAAFNCAQAAWRAGNPTNALSLYTNFVARFPTHPKAPLAQLWVGDYYFNLGNFSAAELNYQQLCENTNWRNSDLVYGARMMAGRAAFQQALWNNAINDFTNLTSNFNCPAHLRVEALFAYGDCELSQLTKDRGDTNNLRHLEKAISLFESIVQTYTNSPRMLLALGRKADALVQLALYTGDNLPFTNALNAYQQIATNNAAEVSVRSMAKMGMAVALKAQASQKSGPEQAALLHQALQHCLDVARGTILGHDEKGDPHWILLAGDEGERLAETLQDWPEAISLCQQLAGLFPPVSARYLERAKTLSARQNALTRN